MLILITALMTLLSFLFIFLYMRERKRVFRVRLGKRGSSVLAAEMEFGSDFELAEHIMNQIKGINDYHIFLVCSGVPEMPPNQTISDKEYYTGKINPDESVNLKMHRQFRDISFFFLNEDIQETEKILLTHDLIVNSAQIPDRELLLESGFIVTVISQSNIIVVTGVRGGFEKNLVKITEYLSERGRDVVLSKM
ncbi:MAG: hypothetical protein N3B13_01525 [Deltaproteobacteria bacterium]|nr:hypothetical protein [Deltaproteobacteria bacterium]